MKYKLLALLSALAFLLLPTVALAAPVTWDFTGNVLQPLKSGSSALVKLDHFQATSTTATSTAADGINLTGGCFAVNGTCIGAGGGGAVSSVFGRTGAVSAQAGDYNTSQLTELTNLFFTNARVLAATLTGYVSGAGTLSSSDTVLSGIQKLNGNIAALVTGVSSFNGRTGAITPGSSDYTTAQIAESGNQYFTNARAQNAITLTTSGTSGAATYSGGTLNIPNYATGGGGSGTVSTSSSETAGQLPYWTTTSGTPAKLGGVATTTLVAGTSITFSGGTPVVIGSSPITINGTGGGGLTGTLGQLPYFSGTNTAVGTSSLFLSAAGLHGIGTTSPSAYAHVNGPNPATVQLKAQGTTGQSADIFQVQNDAGTNFLSVNSSGALNMYQQAQFTGPTYGQFQETTANAGLDFKTVAGTGDITFTPNNTREVTFSNNGKVGIGSSSPFSLLSVGTPGVAATTTLASDLNVGLNGSSNPAFQVLGNISGAVTGIRITPAAAGSNVTLSAISSATDEGFNINAKGSNPLSLEAVGTGALNLDGGNVVFQQSNGNGNGAATNIFFKGTDQSNLTSGAEFIDQKFDMSALGNAHKHANGSTAIERSTLFLPPSYGFTSFSGSNILTEAATVAIDSAPLLAANGKTGTAYGLLIGSSTQGTEFNASTTNAIGLTIFAPKGATNNYAASTSGRWIMNSLNTSATGDVVCRGTSGELLDAGGATCTPSARKYKTDIASTTFDALAQIMQMQPVTFRYKAGVGDGGKQERIGLIADDIAKINTDLVEYSPDGSVHGLHFEEFAGYFVSAIQQIVHKNDTQDTEIAQLQAEVAALKNNQQSYLGCHI